MAANYAPPGMARLRHPRNASATQTIPASPSANAYGEAAAQHMRATARPPSLARNWSSHQPLIRYRPFARFPLAEFWWRHLTWRSYARRKIQGSSDPAHSRDGRFLVDRATTDVIGNSAGGAMSAGEDRSGVVRTNQGSFLVRHHSNHPRPARVPPSALGPAPRRLVDPCQ